MKKPVNFAELIWTMLLFVLITGFNWWLFAIVFLSFPGWITIYDNAVAKANAEKTLKDLGFNEPEEDNE